MRTNKRNTKMVLPVVENKFWLKHNNGGGVHYDGPFRSVDEAHIHAMFCSYKTHGVAYSVVTDAERGIETELTEVVVEAPVDTVDTDETDADDTDVETDVDDTDENNV